MRFMVIVKANKDSEAGVLPDEKILSEMGKFNDRPVEVSATTAGVLVAHDGTEMPLADFDKMPMA